MLKVLGESLHLFGKYLDYEEKYIVAQSKVVAFSIENEMLKAKVMFLSNEVNQAQDFVKVQERDVKNEKAVEKYKKSNTYSNKLCDYYVEGFELFRKYMAKHHPGLDFSTLDMETVEKEILANHPSTKGEVGNVDDRMEDDTVVTVEAPMDLSPSNPA